MGLDVYLVTKVDEAQDDVHDAAWNALWERKEKGELTDEQYEEERKKLPPASNRFEDKHPSTVYPDHLFNRRYLRSSYNSGGFNHAVPEYLGEPGTDLHWIFEPVRGGTDEYSFELTAASVSALEEAKSRALDVAKRLKEVTLPLAMYGPSLRTVTA